MNRPIIGSFAATAVAVVALSVANFELGTATARADEPCSIANQPPRCAPPEGPPYCDVNYICSQMWCPAGSPIRNMPNWDTNVCHTYYFDPDSPLTNSRIIPGPPPGPPKGPGITCIPLIICPIQP